MRLLTLLLVPAALLAGPSRIARLGEFQGQVDVQLTAADPWMPAERNLPLGESAWLRTGPAGRLEIEFDDGGAFRLGPGSLAEISDYTRLSTGQRITVLSLDHGMAYYTGQPMGKDVIMVVTPGAAATVLQGSRIRVVAQPAVVEVAILEGMVRFSSPDAELDVHESNSVQVQPGKPQSFALERGINVAPLDRWSEDRDRLEGTTSSAAYVTGRYGVADLDAAGKWLPSEDLGTVWKPNVADTWAPYRNGHWQYLDAFGYTWVSDDSWGWLPYHNGRWLRKDKVGWVWQPAVSTNFHPGEVYWLRGSDFTGWGPLAPGEAPDGSTPPQAYAAGNSTYASFQADTRVIDGAGFPNPTADQLKKAAFVPALPSPAFLTSRLDATRPVLQVGRTRVLPSVPGVTFGDTPPCEMPSDLMSVPPPNPPGTTVSDTGATPPPDGIYGPPPVVVVPNVDVVGIINAPSHPDYAKPLPGGTKSGSTGTSSGSSSGTTSGTTTTAGGTGSAPAKPPATTPRPVLDHPPDPRPKPPVPVPAATKPETQKLTPGAPGEQDLYGAVLRDIEPSAPNFDKALTDLNAWTKSFPQSKSADDRRYYYIHVYNATNHPDKVLETAAPLVDSGVSGRFTDEQKVLQILVATAAGVQKLPAPTAAQWTTGQKAAKQLLDFLPSYFAPKRKPKNVADGDWSLMRVKLEGIAHDTLARPSAKRVN